MNLNEFSVPCIHVEIYIYDDVYVLGTQGQNKYFPHNFTKFNLQESNIILDSDQWDVYIESIKSDPPINMY